MQHIVECVPNFSDGRRPEVYNAIADAIRQTPGTFVLGVSPDADHNRTVITFVGGPEAVEEAAFRAIGVASQLIDLDRHTGEHPRIGATDVCPFVPVRGVSLDDCVAIARRLGERVGRELGIAVYLYEAAATRPDRTRLAAIRKGEYELWKTEVATNPDREPDFGPAEPRSCGATVIGARPFLIAYNLYLNTGDVTVAQAIARGVRHSSGGLRYVQALGFLVEGQAQVSMNLTDFEKTPVYRVQELVRREAARYGLTITHAELIGLSPQKALLDAAEWYLQLNDLKDEQILELRLQQAMDADVFGAPEAFLAAVAEPNPTPGGGAVAAVAGALGASLAQMMAGLTVGRKKYASAEATAADVRANAATLSGELLRGAAADAEAFDAVMAAYRNKELDDAAKAAAVEEATVGAGEVPLRVARMSRDVARLAATIVQVGNANAVTDGAAAGIMARAAVEIAAMNVKINALSPQDQVLAADRTAEVDALVQETQALAADIAATAAVRAGFA
jgi:glutamate formiminotransferase/formiminotetrahydrofolate cyclodeaminase